MPRTVLPGVVSVSFPVVAVNAFVVNADVLTLVDTGEPGRAGRVLAALRHAGRVPQEVDRILITHRHADHAGSAAELARVCGAEVHVAPGEAPYLRDGRDQGRPQPATPLGRGMVPYVKRMLPWTVEPVSAQETLIEGARVGPFRVLATPGHTDAHVSLLWEEQGALFAGDAAANLTGVGPHPAADDPEQARVSFARLAGLDFDAAVFGHGRAIRAGAARRFRDAA